MSWCEILRITVNWIDSSFILCACVIMLFQNLVQFDEMIGTDLSYGTWMFI